MGNRIARKSPPADPYNDPGAAEISDLRALHHNGREFLQTLQNKLLQTETDRDTLEQELSTVRAWLDRVEAGNAELLEALKDARNKNTILSSEIEIKKQRILALESELESLQDQVASAEFATMGSQISRNASLTEIVSLPDKTRSVALPESEKDKLIAHYQSEISDLKLELRKKDRSMRKEIRRHSRQLRDVSDAELSKEWSADQNVLIDAHYNKSLDRSIDILFKAHKAALTRADELNQTLLRLNSVQLKEFEKQEQDWFSQRSLRRDHMKSLGIGPGIQETHINLSLIDINEDKSNAELDLFAIKSAGKTASPSTRHHKTSIH